jgi:hypothetical protein
MLLPKTHKHYRPKKKPRGEGEGKITGSPTVNSANILLPYNIESLITQPS